MFGGNEIQSYIIGLNYSKMCTKSICQVIERFENDNKPYTFSSCRKNTERFSKENFRLNICEFVYNIYSIKKQTVLF